MSLETFPEDWSRALAIVAHPDDMEYGAAAAVARWTAQGKDITYVLVSDGEAGISSMNPAEVGPLRRQEQIDSCAIVGVDTVEFMSWPDGLIEEGHQLRADLCEKIRVHRPDVVLSINYRDTWGPGTWNHIDHRAVGRALLDAVRDAGNPWIFTDRGEAWDGVQMTAFSGSPHPTHGVDITDTFDLGVQSLAAHAVYLRHLDGDMADPDTFLRRIAQAMGQQFGSDLAASFEVVR